MRIASSARQVGLLALVSALAGCAAGDGVIYKPAAQLLPARIRKIAVRNVENNTQQFGLEDKLTLRIRDEFLRDGSYPVVPEAEADGIVAVRIRRYILVPTQYDAVLTPTVYKLRIVAAASFIEKAANTLLWEEPNLEGIQTYTAETLAGGITEEQARELIWDVLARDVVLRTVVGFGAVTGSSERFLGKEHEDKTFKTKEPELPTKPVNPNLY